MRGARIPRGGGIIGEAGGRTVKRRISRHLFMLSWITSFLLAVTVWVIWVHGWSRLVTIQLVRIDPVQDGSVSKIRAIQWGSGRIMLWGEGYELSAEEAQRQWPARHGRGWTADWFNGPYRRNAFDSVDGPSWLGFRLHYLHRSLPGFVGSRGAVIIPCWFLLPLLLAVPITELRRRVRAHRRRTRALCFSCGYDLRASPGRCPECGAAPAPDGPRAGG
jgi:hypothetical protein